MYYDYGLEPYYGGYVFPGYSYGYGGYRYPGYGGCFGGCGLLPWLFLFPFFFI